jgi:hypothetical protein
MNRVVVIAPSHQIDFFEILSFHCALKRYLGVTDFTVIAEYLPEKTTEFLVKGIRLIKREKSDFGMLESIKFAHKLKDVFNISHVFNLDTSLGSISFTKSLRPKNSYGVKSQVTGLIYDKEFNKPSLLEMLDYVIEEKVEKAFYFDEVESASAENFFKESEVGPFLFVAVDGLQKEAVDIIISLLKVVEDKKIIVWSSSTNENTVGLLNSRKDIINASEVGVEFLYRYISTAFGVITDRVDVARLSNYFLRENFIIGREEVLVANPLMVNKTVSILLNQDSYLLDYSNGQQEKKNDSDEVISIILSLLRD